MVTLAELESLACPYCGRTVPKDTAWAISAATVWGWCGVKLTVDDEGEGISEASRAKLFTPFFTTKDTGLGLGLSLCHRIVEEHRGTIQIESEPLKGTAVSCFLPIAR